MATRKPKGVEVTYMPDHKVYKFKKVRLNAWNEANAKAFYESQGYMSMVVSIEDYYPRKRK